MDVNISQLATFSEITGMRPSVVDSSRLTGYRASTYATMSEPSFASQVPGLQGNDDAVTKEVEARYSLFLDEGFSAPETPDEARNREGILPVSHGRYHQPCCGEN